MKKWLLVLLLFVVAVPMVNAQCSVCNKTASDLDNKSAKGLNGGIVYLAFIPLTIMGALGFVWYRGSRNA